MIVNNYLQYWLLAYETISIPMLIDLCFNFWFLVLFLSKKIVLFGIKTTGVEFSNLFVFAFNAVGTFDNLMHAIIFADLRDLVDLFQLTGLSEVSV